MKAISQGDNTYDIFDDSLKVYDKLPAQAYVVKFSERRGFYLSQYNGLTISEPKIYGAHEEKIEKVMGAFAEMNRSLGVILSGDKGIGKSLFAKLLARKVINMGMPVIIVDGYIKGIASYIESIEQEALVLFDEFDKTFGALRPADGDALPQTELLSLFDGLSGGKKLFVITCNDVRSLYDFFISRPGRFHYHFIFDYPSDDDIRTYLQDKLPGTCQDEIEKVVAFSTRVPLNYDCLRAIAFEIGRGYSFSDAIKDLNIMRIGYMTYSLELKFKNGYTIYGKNYSFDMFKDDEKESVDIWNSDGDCITVSFIPATATYNYHNNASVITAENLWVYYEEEISTILQAAKQSGIDCLIIRSSKGKNLHYAV